MYTQINTHTAYCLSWQEGKYYILLIYSTCLPLFRLVPLAAPQLLPLYPTLLLPPADLPTQDSRASSEGYVLWGQAWWCISIVWVLQTVASQAHWGSGQTDHTNKWWGNFNPEDVVQGKLAFWLVRKFLAWITNIPCCVCNPEKVHDHSEPQMLISQLTKPSPSPSHRKGHSWILPWDSKCVHGSDLEFWHLCYW